MSDLTYPSDLRYTTEHEWVQIQGDTARVGITAFAQDALGDIVYVTLPSVGEAVTAGNSAGEVESTKSVSDVESPICGHVSAVNEALEAAPELLNSDPYGQGWLFEVSIAADAQVSHLLDADAYTALLD